MHAAESFAPLGLSLLATETHGLRRGLHSSAASRLGSRVKEITTTGPARIGPGLWPSPPAYGVR